MECGESELKFYNLMAQPFIEKADRIEKNLDSLEKEERTKKSLSDIRRIREIIPQIQNSFIPRITQATGQKFTFPNLFLFIFLYREIQAVFNDATTNPVHSDKLKNLTDQDLNEMLSVSEDRLTLAYIGDAALEIGIIPGIWPRDGTIPKKQFLHDSRNALVENLPLKNFWNSLFLNDPLADHRGDSPETKGSLMEAVFGIIYLEGGVEAVERAFLNLKKFYEYPKKIL